MIGILLAAAAGITIPLVFSMNEDLASPRTKGTLMIVGGATNAEIPHQPYQYADIINLDNEASDCQSSKYPLQAYKVQAGVVKNSIGRNQTIFCGGKDDHDELIGDCYEYINVSDGFAVFAYLNYGIADSGSAVQVHNGSVEQFLWLTGGLHGVDLLNWVQLASTNGDVLEGPKMPESISYHCAVAISDKAVLVIGGCYNSTNNFSNKTKIYDFESNGWNPGPELTIGRQHHACASFEMDNNWAVYVVGGLTQAIASHPVTDSVEFSVINQDNSSVTVGEWNKDEGTFLLLWLLTSW